MNIKLQLDELKLISEKAKINAIKSKNKKLYEFEKHFEKVIEKYNKLSWFVQLIKGNPDFRLITPSKINWEQYYLKSEGYECLSNCADENHVIRKTKEIIKLPPEIKELEIDIETYNKIIDFYKISVDDDFLENNDPLNIWNHFC